MNKTVKKANKKEEQKKLVVRIVCMVLVVALLVTSLLAMFPTLFQNNDTGSVTLTLQDLVNMGLIEIDEDGNIVMVDDSLIVTDSQSTEEHDHDHE